MSIYRRKASKDRPPAVTAKLTYKGRKLSIRVLAARDHSGWVAVVHVDGLLLFVPEAMSYADPHDALANAEKHTRTAIDRLDEKLADAGESD
ncbi:hypothetical protein J8I26_17160 [Herbaspirillum sp. LeCh32-8]|uniref:hypothetical protein n=1 Tax=Herbaspirillum sp. LeCh32-8 TaxID=2821356 RepID=UPI001AE3B3E7|nr:hypothetical protein [Herbaspirillum sp. LeCh32-8]MBP0599843.1 hypothetical protein [Herbaspirillum sp. LeCh32-8]